MRYGFVLPYGDAHTTADLAVVAEDHGWDGFFVWEGIWAIDPWVSLAAAAVRTERIRLGTMLTPLPRRRPWELAGQTSTLDNLSGGRVILSVGLGVAGEDRWWLFEDDPGRAARAQMLDEGLAMLERLWREEPFEFEGRHFTSRLIDSLVPPAPPAPVQKPRIPTWVVGAWPFPKSMRRSARWDGWIPHYQPVDASADGQLTPEIFGEGAIWIREQRATEGLPMAGYDLIMEGATPADDPKAAAEQVRPWAQAGATWWLDADWSSMDPARVREASERRLRAGPPRVDH
ncbi:LLM class flavin-dependent oxidoreductase [Actinopolymorpha alba]|uniref:LLM class flavin-dependent oxidoreductase n=1 Tax=Actinopolymorpha alba TaxID=533267 RepID=UPI0003731148|nr:LLM class flavin-dependent oxidoreductase [Actinopolymorpha alba]